MVKYNEQDTAHGCNGDYSRAYIFTPATNPNPPTNWRGTRVELAELDRKTYNNGDVLNLDLCLTLLDSKLLDNVRNVGISQLWSKGTRMPKYFLYLSQYRGNYYLKVRHTTKDKKYIFQDKHMKIEVGVEYRVNTTINISDDTSGHISTTVNGKDIFDLSCQTHDTGYYLEEKFGLYWDRTSKINYNEYPKTLLIEINRDWLK